MSHKKTPLAIIGGGGHARVIAAIIEKHDSFELIGYTDTQRCPEFNTTRYLGTDAEFVKRYLPKDIQLVIGVGIIKPSESRFQIFQKFTELGFSFPPIISKDMVYNSQNPPGEGAVLFDGVVVNPGARIGVAAIVNTNATVEHDCIIGNNVHIAPGSTICGDVKIGDHTMIGAGSTVIQGKEIASRVLLGAGSLVIKNLLSPGTYFGVPAKKVLND